MSKALIFLVNGYFFEGSQKEKGIAHMEVDSQAINQAGDARKGAYSNMHDQAVKALANSIYKQLQNEGCQYKDIIGVSSQLLSLVTLELKDSGQD